MLNITIVDLAGSVCQRIAELPMADSIFGEKLPKDVVKQTYTCSYCKANFTRNRNLKRHLLSVHRQKLSEGTRCIGALLASDISIVDLAGYVCQHMTELPTTESIFGETLRRDVLKQPYACSFCQKYFTETRSLNRHLLSVHRQRLRKGARCIFNDEPRCPGCGKPFSRIDSLNRHLYNSSCKSTQLITS